MVSRTSGWCYKIDSVNFAQYNEVTTRRCGIRRGENGCLWISKPGVFYEPVPWEKINSCLIPLHNYQTYHNIF